MSFVQPHKAVYFGKGKDYGTATQKAVPYIYNFVDSENDNWNTVKDNSASVNNLAGIGPLIKAGKSGVVNIRMGQDYPFKISKMRFEAYKISGGQYIWQEYTSTVYSLIDANRKMLCNPLTRYLDVLAYSVTDGKLLFGGHNQSNELVAMSVSCINSENNINACLGNEYIIPRSGMIKIEIFNTSTTHDIVVGGSVYGWKLRI